MNQNLENVSLPLFEGPLPFLVHLIRKKELEITTISLFQLILQITNKSLYNEKEQIDPKADCLETLSLLLYFKSKALLPFEESGEEIPEDDKEIETLFHLLDFCKVKKIARALGDKEEAAIRRFTRPGPEIPEKKKSSGIDHLVLEELAKAYQVAIDKANQKKTIIRDEFYSVSDKITLVRLFLADFEKKSFHSLFSKEMSKVEAIVTFLAVLELLKNGEVALCIEKEGEKKTLLLFRKER